MSHAVAHPAYLVAGFLAAIVCAYLSSMKIEKWRIANGIAPPPGRNRIENAEYNSKIKREMPAELRRHTQTLVWIGFSLAVIGAVLSDL